MPRWSSERKGVSKGIVHRSTGEAAIEYRMHVPPGADGKPAIRVNKAVPDAVFDASNVVSSGWMISDRTTGETRRVN